MMTGIPVNKIAESESEKLLKMDTVLRTQIIGQDEALTQLTKAIRRTRAGLERSAAADRLVHLPRPNRRRQNRDGESACPLPVRFGRCFDPHRYERVYGKIFRLAACRSAPGYVGYEEGGQLTEKVRRKPYAVVLLDEIEKAHPDVFNILLQVLDDGILTDSLGRRVDFKNTILIMTSNIGARDIKSSGGFGFGDNTVQDKYKAMKNVIEEALKRVFNPEFLNRVDDTIVFHALEKSHIMQIIDIATKDLFKRMSSMNITIELNKPAKEFLAEKGFDPAFGARPLRRALQKYVEDPVSEEILKGKFSDGSKIKVKFNKKTEQLKFIDANKNRKKEEPKKEEEKKADVT